MTPERRSLYEQFFKDADKNEDGVLVLDELGSLISRLGFQGSKAELTKMFEVLDKNKDERISCEELITYLSSCRSNLDFFEADLRAVFRRYDRDHNGTVSREELRIGLQEQNKSLSDKQLDEAIEKADKNHDGVVDYEEFLTLIRAIHK